MRGYCATVNTRNKSIENYEESFLKSFIDVIFSSVKASDFYNFTVTDKQGRDYPLEQLPGKVSLVINVASKCGFTDSTYRALTKLHDLSNDGYFTVLAFPCNQFGDQEPDKAADVAEAI
ncbi:Glutathione peroxidase 7 [Hyalella azteca]|uniref:Glutathione peroxidase n=1 Tax=Hyalella azteca TaxID=294128 RepID=A0A6A0H9N7_HYAAZ|nr:Glutathione peroxidase 7 [Hyalella azteca]